MSLTGLLATPYQFLIFLSFFIFFATIGNLFYDYSRRGKLMRKVYTEYENEKLKGMMGVLKPFLQDATDVMRALPIFKEMLHGKNKRYQRLILRAGEPGLLTGEEVYALKLIAPLAAVFVVALVFPNVIAIGVTAALFFIWPDMWLQGKMKKRMRQMGRTLPDAMDSIALTMRAGLDLSQAIDCYIEGIGQNLLKTEFYLMRAEMRVGKTRMQALQDMAQRVGLPELLNLATAVTQAEKSGISVTDYLAQQADELRMNRFRKAEEMGQKAPLKMLIPLMLFIMPGVFIVLFGPMIISFI